MTILRAQVLPHRGNVVIKSSDDKLLVFNWSQAQLQVDFFAMVSSLLFEEDYTFINGSFAFSLA